MNLAIYQVDAFTDHVFGGNPAAVIPLSHWLDEATLQAIATENNLSETAFITAIDRPDNNKVHNVDSNTKANNNVELNPSGHLAYELRWFTPVSEVAMCGHATLAAAHVLFTQLGINGEQIEFVTKSGTLWVKKYDDGYVMDFPAVPSEQLNTSAAPETLLAGLTIDPIKINAVSLGTDYLIELASQADVENLQPDISHWQSLNARGVIVTARAEESQTDFVSRCFYPEVGIAEDPVTGSAHCQLAPYWAKKLGKNKLDAIQLSARRGHLYCEVVADRIKLIGQVVDYMVGEIRI